MAILGCIADDFTGASDAAAFLVKGGLSTQLFSGVPDSADVIHNTAQAYVIALKTRTMETKKAVLSSLIALKWLKNQGINKFYIKYCSTFDSTPTGNIGPIADAALNFLDAQYTLLCPSLPVNGRTVKNGNIYVNGIPLHETSMKNHPLTPMLSSNIPTLMQAQSKYPCILLSAQDLLQSYPAIRTQLLQRAVSMEADRFYVVPDYQSEKDGERIASLFGHLPLLTGGSGLIMHLAHQMTGNMHHTFRKSLPPVSGPALLLAGSCSKVTLSQIKYFQAHGGISRKIDAKLLSHSSLNSSVEDLWDFILQHWETPVLIYSSDTTDHVKEAQKQSRTISEDLEELFARLAERAIAQGCHRLIIAGGETSGAVTKKLGFDAYEIGDSISPGIPIMAPIRKPNLRLILKSGNFGEENFFEKALLLTTGRKEEPQ